MNKEISIRTINNVKKCLLRIYEAEDNDYVDDNYYKKIKANERAINHYLKDYSDEQQRELRDHICWYDDNCSASLEKIGWKIIRGK